MSHSRPIRVLVVDDSAFARKVIREVLSRDPAIEVVGIARDGLEALEKLGELRPEVMTLDLLMPELDGLGVLRAMPKDSPTRVVVVSVSGSDTELAVEALETGAVDLVTKPTALATDRLYDLSTGLIPKVKAAAGAKPRLGAPRARGAEPLRSVKLPAAPALKTQLVVIGTSTGGPQALTQLLQRLPAGLPVPLAIALHIPAGYTAPLASRISQLSEVKVEEAVDGMTLQPGRAVIAPGGQHLRVEKLNGQFVARVSPEPLESLYHPSVDVLFESAAKNAGDAAVGLIMTGMGDDGLRGARAIQAVGGRVLAESASSCVVYGMPRSVIEAGVARSEAPLEGLPELLVRAICGDSCD